jgi:prepilin-type N-terminal cleavage/methylation domain-containing protein
MLRYRGNHPHRPVPRAFTLVEILIVAVIIGIVAAIAVPQFQNFSSDASATALKTDLMRLRDAVRRYEADHGGFPSAETIATQLTHFSDRDGTTTTTKDATHVFGPYLMSIPKLPVGDNVGDTIISADPEAEGAGWCYDATTGHIYSNTTDDEIDVEGKKFNEY